MFFISLRKGCQAKNELFFSTIFLRSFALYARLIRELRNVGAAVNISGRVIVLSVGGSRELLSLLDSVLGPNSLVAKFGVQIETAAILIRHFYSTPYKSIALSGNVLP